MRKAITDETRRLRDHRRPGWFWAENELFDVFQPLIGALGVSVYLAFCREARQGSVRLSLREIANLSGVSKDTASRVIARMVLLGMIGETRGGMKMASTYDLFDLKDAAEVGVAELKKRLSVSEGDSEVAVSANNSTTPGRSSVSQGDSERKAQDAPSSPLPETDLVVPETVLSLPAANLSHGKDTYIRNKTQDLNNTPLPPANGGRVDRAKHIASERTIGMFRGGGSSDFVRPDAALLESLLPGMRRAPAENSRSLVVAARGFLEELHDEFARAYGMPLDAAQKRDGWEDPLTAWQRCFEHVAVGDVELDGDVPVVTLLTRRPAELQAGLERYAARVKNAMRKAFGREVQLIPRDEAVAA